jgi:hypothetical protein
MGVEIVSFSHALRKASERDTLKPNCVEALVYLSANVSETLSLTPAGKTSIVRQIEAYRERILD